MKLRKPVRIALWSLAGLGVALVGLYLLRWPLLEGVVRSKIAELVRTHLKAEVEIGRLGGSLISGLHAESVTLKPLPGSPIGPSSVRTLDVSTGLFFTGTPVLRVEGARVAIAASEGPAPPPPQTARDVVSTLRTLKMPLHATLQDAELLLPGGRRLRIERASVDEDGGSLAFEDESFGSVRARLRLEIGGAWRVEGRASEGPVRSATIALGRGESSAPLRIEALVEGQALRWEGNASFEAGALVRVEGELSVKEGHAKTRVEFPSGKAEIDVDAVYPLSGDVQGDVAILAHGQGPVAGPYEEWTLREAVLRTKGATARGIPLDEAELTLGAGGLTGLPFKLSGRSGEDRVAAEGRAAWNGKLDLEATLQLEAVRLKPYLALLPEPPRIELSAIRLEGKLDVKQNVPFFDGSVRTGAGAFEELTWQGVAFQGSATPGRLESRSLTITGTPYAPKIDVLGRLEGQALSLQVLAGSDRLEFDGRLSPSGDYDGTLKINGPLDWLKSVDVSLPAEYLPVRAAGTIAREKDEIRVGLRLRAGEEALFSPIATARRTADGWKVAMAAGSLTLPGKRQIEYAAFPLELQPGRALLEKLRIVVNEPAASGLVSGSVDWDPKRIRIALRVDEPSVLQLPIEPLDLRVAIDRASGEISPELSWGRDDGDRLRFQGRWGKEIDLSLAFRANDLRQPLIRRLVPFAELDGGISLDAHLTGTPERPELTGTLTLSKISAGGAPPLSLLVPLKSEDGVVKVWAVAETTPYGQLTIGGEVPLPGSPAPLDLSLRLTTSDFSPLLARLTPSARVWIPKGSLTASLSLLGTLAKPVIMGRAEFAALHFQPPPPLAAVSDLRVSLRFDPTGVDVTTLDGLLGGGPFWASGRWDLTSPGRPLSLWVTGRDALVVDEALTLVRVTPDAILSWDEKSGLRLTGRVEVPIGIWHREFMAASIGAPTPTKSVSAPRMRLIPAESGGFLIPGIEGLEAVQLDLQARTTGEFRIENSLVGVILSVEGQLTGTGAEPVLSGVIRSRPRRGEVKLAPGNFLRIESAEILLPEEPGRSATVRFEARVGAGDTAIEVRVEGPLDGPSLVLRSEPPRPQKELLARVAFGQESGAMSTETAGATVALYLYASIQDAWPDADRKEGFFDKFRPTIIPGESSQQRRVPWELPPTGSAKSTSLRTEYVYNSYFSVIAETSREGDVGGDLKLRIRF